MWLLVLIPVLVTPFENQLAIGGFSLAKCAIIPLLITVLLARTSSFISTLKQPVSVLWIAFLVWGVIAESLHRASDWELLYRMLQMFVFGALVASVLSGPEIMRRTLVGLLLVCALLACYLIINFYGIVNIDARDAMEAGAARLQISKATMGTNLNQLGYTVGMGAVVALSRFLESRRLVARCLWGAVYLLCSMGLTVTVSRGAFLALAVVSILVTYRSLRKRLTPQKLILILVAGLVLYGLLPNSLTTRLASTMDDQTGVALEKQEARRRVFTATIESLSEYWTLGVGAGNFWDGWGRSHGFYTRSPRGRTTLGPHSAFFAVWIYFGLPGLILFCMICYAAARQRPRREDKSWEASTVLGLMVLGVFWLIFTHDLYLKEFGLILGLALGGIWKQRLNWLKRRSQNMIGITRVEGIVPAPPNPALMTTR